MITSPDENRIDHMVSKILKGKQNPAEANLLSEEEKDFTQIIQKLATVPLNTVPRGLRRQKFLEVKKSWWRLGYLTYRASIVPLTLLIMVACGLGVAQAKDSKPGEGLFVIKRAGETLKVKLASDPTKKANLQIQIMEKRLQETQVVLNETSNSDLKAAALTELSEQTKTALDTVKQVATTKALEKDDTGDKLLTSFEEVANQQKDILNKVATTDEATKEEATAALQTVEESNKTVAQIRTILIAVNEQTLTTLPAEEKEQEPKEEPPADSTEIPKPTPKPQESSSIPSPEAQNTENNVRADFIVESP